MLKEALKQSGCSWDHERFMIQAEPHLWENLIVSFPKIKKFRNLKATFPLFHVLGELYDGHLAEGNYNFTSLRFPEDEALKQILLDAEDEVQVLDDTEAEEVHGEDPNVHQMEEDDVEVVKTRLDNVPREKEESAQQTRQQRRISATTKHDKKEEKESKKANKSSNVEGMMERYLEMRTKQVQQESELLARENPAAQGGTDFSIKRCISVLNKMEVTSVENIKAYSVFKSEQNREIFLSSYEEDEESTLMWLRTEIAPKVVE